MNVKIKKLDPAATIPQYATEGAACFDLHSIGPVGSARFNQPAVFRTGLQFEVPQGHVMLVFSRSGHGFKNGIRLANCVGVIDSDYRGEVMVKLTCDESGRDQEHLDSAPIFFPGDRIAQAMILPVQQVNLEEVSELSETKRGQGGFGSTGA